MADPLPSANETAGDRLARARAEVEAQRRMDDPITRGDVLFMLETVHASNGTTGALGYLVYELARKLEERWGIHA